ncbi:MAG: TolC family protein [Chitinophagaceae bacterium]
MKSLLNTILGITLLFQTLSGYAQYTGGDTLKISLPEAEKTFLQNNLLLLAQQYNVKAAKAMILQAKLWNNPNLSISQGAYNPETKKYFQVGAKDGEESASIQQLFLLAGKRNKQIKMAQTNYQLTQYGLFDLLRTLKFTLRSDFFEIYFNQQTSMVYQEEISGLQKVVKAFEEQNGKGYIPETEVVRIKAQLYSLLSEYADLTNQINDKESELRQILQIKNTYLVPEVDSAKIASLNPKNYSLKTLIDSALLNRTDLMIAQGNLLLSQQNFSYQKALAIPDLTLGLGYDKNGSYVHNFNAVALSFDLPIFNRNQGDIRAAKNLIEYNQLQLQSTLQSIQEQVQRAEEKAIDANNLSQSIDPKFASEFNRLSTAVFKNYEKRNIGLLEFLDFYDSYKQNIVQQNYILMNRVLSFENINYITGTNFFN